MEQKSKVLASHALRSFLFLSLLSCGRPAYVELPTQRASDQLQYEVSEYILGREIVDSISHTQFSVYEDKAQPATYLMLMNQTTKRLEIYDLDKRSRVFAKPLQDFIGDEAIFGPLNSLHFHNFDTLLLEQEQQIVLADTSGPIATLPTNRFDDDNNPKSYYLSMGHTPIRYDAQRKAALVQAYSMVHAFHQKPFYEHPVEALVGLEAGHIQHFRVPYSKKYLQAYYGFANHVHRSVAGNHSIYSFSVDPNIYIYDRQLDTLIIAGGRSKYQQEDAEPLPIKYKHDREQKYRHMILVPHYLQVLFDPYRQYYYRFFLEEIPEKNEDGTYNSWVDKRLVLMVFDRELRLLEEIDLGRNQYNFFRSFVAREGLFVAHSRHQNPNYDKYELKFDLYRFFTP